LRLFESALILRRDDLTLSVQVLQEFYVQATRPTRTQPLSHEEAVALIHSWLRFPVQENTVALLQAAMAAKVRFQVSFWDAAIIEAARAAGCRQILSEDLNHGQDYDGLVVVNPFAS
jgi:predicted nucleic acid-binding protein